MKAVRMVAVGQPLELFDVPAPRIGDRDVLVRVKAAGICHSDVHYRPSDRVVLHYNITWTAISRVCAQAATSRN